MTFEEFAKEWDSEIPYAEVRTSGSTGTPKTITLQKEFMRRSARRTNYFFGINRGDRLHSCISADSIGGKMLLVRAREAGAEFTWETPSNRPLEEAQGDIKLLSVVTSQLNALTDSYPDKIHIDNILVGGSPVSDMLREKCSALPCPVYESYGMTETASHIAIRRVQTGTPPPFRPLPGISVATDSRGCLEIRFDSGETILTNDLATVFPDGTFRIDGRYDSMIISGGKKINPMEVERILQPLFGNEILVTSAEDLKWGQMVVVLSQGEAPDTEEIERLRARIREAIDPVRRPKLVEWVESLPLLSSGKPDRRTIKYNEIKKHNFFHI